MPPAALGGESALALTRCCRRTRRRLAPPVSASTWFSELRRRASPELRAALDVIPLRGWHAGELSEVKAATHGRGLFARTRIERGAVLGEYGGVMRPAAAAWAKCQRRRTALQYVFQTDDGTYVDPTDDSGAVADDDRVCLLGPLLAADAALARINESEHAAAAGGGSSLGCNVDISEPRPGQLLIVTTRDVEAGAELLMNYGSVYDRSHYYTS